MPEVEHLDTPGFSFAPLPDPVAKPAPSFFTQTLPAAFRMENDVLNAINYVQGQRTSYAPTPGFDPGAKLREIDKAERSSLWDLHGKNFIGVRSEEEFAAKLAKIKQEETDRDVLERSGAGGVIASVMAGMASPTILLPFIGEARGLRAAAVGAGYGFAGGLGQEIPLQMNQETRTAGEGAFSVATSTVVSGILGGAVGVLRGNERRLLEQTLEREVGTYLSPGRGAIPASGSAGAEKAGGMAAGGLAPGVPDIITQTSPVLRTIDSQVLPTASRTMAALADGGVQLEGNARGIAGSVGGTIESLVKTYDATYVKAINTVDEAYGEYFYAGVAKPGIAPNFQATVRGYFDSTHMSKTEFKTEVSRALWSEDKHSNPFVQKTAQKLRQEFFDPMLKEAQRVGLIGDNIDLKGDMSYLFRDYDINKIKANTNQFIEILAKNYEEQALADYQNKLAKLKGKEADTATLLEDLQLDAPTVEARRAEFQSKLRQLENSRLGVVRRAEEEINDLRNQARVARKAGDDGLADQLLEEARQLEKDAGPMLQETRADRSALKKRLRNLSKSRVVFEQKQAAKLDKIERLEELNSDALMNAARKGQEFLNKLDTVTPDQFRAEVNKLKGVFNQLGERYDAIQERIARLIDQEGETDLARLLKQDEAQTKLGVRMDQAIDQLENAEDMLTAVPVFREILQEQLDTILAKLQKNMEARTLRSQRLSEQAAKLDPAIVTKRIEDIKMASAARRQEFFEKMRMAGAELLPNDVADFRAFARELAVEAKDKIIGTYLRAPAIDLIRSERGSEINRAINISSLKIADFLSTDTDILMKKYVRTVAPDIEIMRKFQTLDWEEIIRPIVDEMNNRLEQLQKKVDKDRKILKAGGEMKDGKLVPLTPSEKLKLEKFLDPKNQEKLQFQLNKEFTDRKQDLEAVYSRLRGTWGIPEDPDAIGYRLGKTVLNLNVLRLMGGTLISSIADAGRPIMKHGLTRVFGDGFSLMINDWKAFKMSAREVRLAGAALDPILHSRARALADVVTDHATTSKLERGIDFLTGKMGQIAGFDYWSSAMKQFSGVVANARFLDSVDLVVNGAGTKAEIAEATRFLAEHNIDGGLARKIWKEVEAGGADKVNGTWLPNTEMWKDKDVVRSFRAALVQNVDNTIIQPGAELPLTMNQTVANRLLFQFKSFGMSSTYKTVAAGLQQRDMAVLNGIMVSLALGALSYYIHATLAGGKVQGKMLNADPAAWADEAIQRSGVIGVFADAQKITERLPYIGKYSTMSGLFGDGERLQKNAANGMIETLLGPSFGFAKTLAEAIAGVEEPTQSTLQKFRMLVPFQNLVGVRRMLDAVIENSGFPERRDQ